MIWIVRDEEGGVLMPYVSLWSERPKRWAMGDGHVWLSETLGDPLHAWLGSLLLADAWRIVGTTPDDDRQVIVADRCPRKIYDKITKANELRVPRPRK